MKSKLKSEKQIHVRFENLKKIDRVRIEHKYASFAEFVREAVAYFIGWLEGNKK